MAGDTRVIGIDTSGDYGSGIAGALVDASGSVSAKKTALTPRTRDDLIDSLATMGGRLLEQSRRDGQAASALGVAVPGLVDERSGTVHRTPNLTLDEVPLGPMLQERLGIPVFLVHDAIAGALAENSLGWDGAWPTCCWS